MSARRLVLVVASIVLSAACGGNVAVGKDGATTSTTTTTGTGTGTTTLAPDLFACARASDCFLTSPGCCGLACGELGLGDVVAVAVASGEAYRVATCDAGPGPVACPGCAAMPNPALGVRCDAGRCQAYDASALGTCASDADCVLRHGSGCCDVDCSPESLVALPKAVVAQIEQWTCEGGSTCGACPVGPGGPVAVCGGGRCTIAYPQD